VVRRSFLKRKGERHTDRGERGTPALAELLELLRCEVVERFSPMCTCDLQAVALAVSEPDEAEPAPNPSHPACADFATSDYCRESWQLHLAELKRQAETHWGTCQHGRICAIVPVVSENCCLAVVKLAGPAAPDESEFKRLMEKLELLVRDFASMHADFLRRVPGGMAMLERVQAPPGATQARPGASCAPPTGQPRAEVRRGRGQVARALRYVEAHIFDPRLSVAHVARELAIHPNYLSQLFSAQVGVQLHRFIRARRITLAETLLATTDWQIKRIARETGHANPNWFCHVFRECTGMTPTGWRERARQCGWTGWDERDTPAGAAWHRVPRAYGAAPLSAGPIGGKAAGS